MVVLKQEMLFTSRSLILEGPRPQVEAFTQFLRVSYPESRQQYSMFDLTNGSWRVLLEIPQSVG